MPLAAMTIAGVVDATSSIDSCADATIVMRAVPNTADVPLGRFHVGIELVARAAV